MSEMEKFIEKAENFSQELKKLEEHLAPLLKFESIDDLSGKVPLTDLAKLNNSMAYTLISYYWMYMKVNGISTQDHNINKEIERVKAYAEKIQLAITKEKEFNNSKVNKEVAGRIIKAQLSQNNVAEEQKKMELEKLKAEADDWEARPEEDQPKKKKMHKGALMPDTQHLSWKQSIEKMLK